MPSSEIAIAFETGQPVSLHAGDGEVLVARILSYDADEICFMVVSSSRPERYAVCDSTGFRRRWHEIERAVLVSARKKR